MTTSAQIVAAMQAGAATWTPADIAAFQAEVNALSAPPIQITNTTGGSLTDSAGHVWSFGGTAAYGSIILRDGAFAAGGQGTVIALKGAQIKVQNSLGDWYLWSDTSPNWSGTTAP